MCSLSKNKKLGKSVKEEFLLFKKICSLFICMIFCVEILGTGKIFAASTSMSDQLAQMEETVYGSVQTGGLLDRIKKLEGDIGETSSSSSGIMQRIDTLYDVVFRNELHPSLVAQINAIEWTCTEEVSMEPILNRIVALEKFIFNKSFEGTYKERISTLSKSFGDNKEISLVQATVPVNTLLKIALVTPVNAKTTKEGDVIEFKVAEDVIESNHLLFAKGAAGSGVVTKVSRAKLFGQDAKVEIDFKKVYAVDGTEVETTCGEEAQQKMKSMAIAGGASVAGMLVLGPIGAAAGLAVKGSNVDWPAGTETYIQTKNDATVYGIELK